MRAIATTWYIIINPAAAGGRAGQLWPDLAKQLAQAGVLFEQAFSTHHRHATSLAAQAIGQGYKYLMAVGGDGTNNEVINGIFQQSHVPHSSITYCLLPIGTGNDWIKTHHIPRDRKAWLNMLLAGQVRLQDVGWVEYQDGEKTKKHYFANVAGLAYDAFVVHYVEDLKTRVANKLVYLWVVLRCLWKYQLQSARLLFEDKSVEDQFYTINVGIGKYSGGGMQLVPHAAPSDGFLALTYAGPLKKWQVILNTYRFYNGSLGRHPLVHTEQVKQLVVEPVDGGTATLLEVDGEFLGVTPARFGIEERALRFIAPTS